MTVSTRTRVVRIATGIIQQLVKNGGGMVTSLALALFLSAEEFGAFAIVLAVHGIFNLMHAAFLAEPMTLFATRVFRDRQDAYFTSLERTQIFAAAGMSAVLALSATVCGAAGAPPLVTGGLWVLAAVQPFALLANYFERRLYLDLRADLAMWGAGIQLVAVTAAIVGAAWTGLLGVPLALALLGGGYAIAAVVHSLLLRRITPPPAAGGPPIPLSLIAERHLGFGRWSAVGHGLWWLVQNMYIFATGLFLSLAAVGSFKILITLSNVGTLAMSALGMILMPMLAGARDATDESRIVRLAAALVLCGGGLFAAAFMMLAPWGIPLLFGDKFSLGWAGLALAAIYPTAAGLQYVTTTIARARGAPDASVYGTALALTIASGPGLAMVLLLSVPGSMAAQLVTVLTVFLAIAWFLRRRPRTPPAATRPEADTRGIEK